MIDVYNLVFDTIYNGIITDYPNANITAGYDEETSTFPCVVVTETDNAPYAKMSTDDNVEPYTVLTYEISVYSDRLDTARSECAELLGAVDDVMQKSMKFRRIRKNRPVNINRTIYRQYALYEVIVREGVASGENTVYQMYRR